jgi:hypothetical protein
VLPHDTQPVLERAVAPVAVEGVDAADNLTLAIFDHQCECIFFWFLFYTGFDVGLEDFERTGKVDHIA